MDLETRQRLMFWLGVAKDEVIKDNRDKKITVKQYQEKMDKLITFANWVIDYA